MAKNEEISNLVNKLKFQHSTSMKGIAELVGVSYKYLSNVVNGHYPLSEDLKARLYRLCTDYEEEIKGLNGVPVYEVDFNGGFVERYNNASVEQVGSIDLPHYRKATCVVSVTGDSMHPLISSGDQIILREVPVTEDSILYGGIYAVATDNDLRTVKRIRKSPNPGCIDLEPINKEVADTTTIKFSRIVALWRVLGCIKPLN